MATAATYSNGHSCYIFLLLIIIGVTGATTTAIATTATETTITSTGTTTITVTAAISRSLYIWHQLQQYSRGLMLCPLPFFLSMTICVFLVMMLPSTSGGTC